MLEDLITVSSELFLDGGIIMLLGTGFSKLHEVVSFVVLSAAKKLTYLYVILTVLCAIRISC